ncbi:MAG: UbiX family flavin prenyltransferase [Phycisphaerales bacterium]|nr:UbiX family flavin prenyltransferase [Phycisphaerales bacterium]
MSARNGHPGTSQPPGTPPRRFVVGVSGASGALYATRLLEELLASGAQVHLVATEYGRRLLHDELGVTALELAALCPGLADRLGPAGVAAAGDRLFVHPHKDVGAVIASGSFLHDGMVVVPCSSTALGYIANGSGSNLLGRAAMVTLKERRRLILVHRETPLSLIDIRNMEAVTLAGGIVAPANPGFYLGPSSVGDLVDFVVGKCLDLLSVPHALNTRWEGHAPAARAVATRPTEAP